MAQEIAKPTASLDRHHAQEHAAMRRELRWCDRQPGMPPGLRLEYQATGSQVL
jgi:hypothetical protein